MHAGYWDDTTKTLRQALRKENEILAEKAQIKSSDLVLDAGCGVGGSSIFLTQRYGCEVVGITLSEKQAETATAYASEKLPNANNLPQFYVMDFNHTYFPDESFDVVWAIESICHSSSKLQFVEEAYRLLKKGGRLIIADAFYTKKSYTPSEEEMMNRWLKGWGVSTLELESQFALYLVDTGFKSISFTDITTNVIPSSQRLFYYSFPGILLSKLNTFLNRGTALQAANFLSARYQYKSLKKGLWKYGIFYGEKL